MTVRDLHRRWARTSVLAIAAFAVLAWLETRLATQSGYNMRSLQFATTALDYSRITTAWIAPYNALLAGFGLGFDYLFMPLYAFSFFYSGLIVRERFTPKAGLARRLLQLVAAIPLAGGLADAVENGLETTMLVSGATDSLARLAFTATTAKLLCFFIGLALLVAAVLVRLLRRKAEEPA